MEIFHEIMRIYLVSFLFFLMDTLRVTERRIVGRFCNARKRQKQKRVKEISSVNVSRNFFPLPFILFDLRIHEFVFWNIPSLSFLEYQWARATGMWGKNRNRNANVAKECRVSIWRERKREIDTKQERERERAFPYGYRIKHLVK